MKKIILSMLMVVAAVTALNAQKVKSPIVPEKVRSALTVKYPAAVNITWGKEKGNYEANWGGKSGEDMSVQFTPEGTFIEQVAAIKVSDLPAGVAAYVKQHYKGVKITEAGKITDAKGITMFEKAGTWYLIKKVVSLNKINPLYL
ncbi:hypothetical protein [Mucilaginibacter sp.]|uniref:hypothetical protein n=1 Tax=Mucilaginibacter sp. TaxID=1882438 RepID=UPI0026294F13|nr:hypothetical protein [Mucilaginibacter sp.]MDB4919702.1 hypothetical protein [Mucilaginibacter sp.]